MRRIAPGTALRLWTDDAFCGALRSATDLSSEKVDLRFVNPQTGPFYVEGAEPGDTLALHFVAMAPARDWGASAAIPFFGGLTGTDRIATLQDPLPDTTWIYELDRARNTVTFAAQHSDLRHRAAGRADARHGRRRPGRAGGAQLAGARPLRRQHGHPADAGRHHLLPRRQRRGRAVLGRRRPLPAGRGRDLRHGRRGRDETTLIVELIKGGAPAWPRLEDDAHWMTVGSSRPLEDAWRIGQVGLFAGSASCTGWTRWTPTSCSPRSRESPLANVVDANYSAVVKARKSLLPRATAYGGLHDELRSRAASLL